MCLLSDLTIFFEIYNHDRTRRTASALFLWVDYQRLEQIRRTQYMYYHSTVSKENYKIVQGWAILKTVHICL